MLLQSPLRHLHGPTHSEDASGGCAGGERKGDPSVNLCCVVGASDVVEKEAAGNNVFLGPCWPQVGQDPVAPARQATGNQICYMLQVRRSNTECKRDHAACVAVQEEALSR